MRAFVFLDCAEIAPLEYRHISSAATTFSEWLMTFITVFAGPIGFEKVAWYFWLRVVAGNVIGVLFVFLLCPNTSGKTLEQVDYLFVEKGFAGLRKNFDVQLQDLEGWRDKVKVVETRAVAE